MTVPLFSQRELDDFRRDCPGTIGVLILDRDGAEIGKSTATYFRIPENIRQLVNVSHALAPLLGGALDHAESMWCVAHYETIIVAFEKIDGRILVLFMQPDAKEVLFRGMADLLARSLEDRWRLEE